MARFCYHCSRPLKRDINGHVIRETRVLVTPGWVRDQTSHVSLHRDCARQFDAEQKELSINARPRDEGQYDD